MAIAKKGAGDLDTKIPQLLELANRLSGDISPGMGDGATEDDGVDKLNELVRNLGISAPKEL